MPAHNRHSVGLEWARYHWRRRRLRAALYRAQLSGDLFAQDAAELALERQRLRWTWWQIA